MSGRTVITFGTFDVFHVGHIRVLQRAAALGDRLVVGVSPTRSTSRRRAGRRSTARTSGWRSSRAEVVDEVFVEESLEKKRDYILEHDADVLVMGDDWAASSTGCDVCEVVYLPRTPSVSTTGSSSTSPAWGREVPPPAGARRRRGPLGRARQCRRGRLSAVGWWSPWRGVAGGGRCSRGRLRVVRARHPGGADAGRGRRSRSSPSSSASRCGRGRRTPSRCCPGVTQRATSRRP